MIIIWCYVRTRLPLMTLYHNHHQWCPYSPPVVTVLTTVGHRTVTVLTTGDHRWSQYFPVTVLLVVTVLTTGGHTTFVASTAITGTVTTGGEYDNHRY